MELRVLTAFHYLTEVEGISWRDEDYVANKLVKALKGKMFNGKFRRLVDGVNRTYDNANVDTYVDYICRRVGSTLATAYQRPFLIVPIPNSPALAADKSDFRTWELARNIAKHTKGLGSCEDLLRWKRRALRSHDEKGSRNPDVLRANLQLRRIPHEQIVLFDDVFTSGAHLSAAARLLSQNGADVQSAFVFARATRLQMPAAFKPATEVVYY